MLLYAPNYFTFFWFSRGFFGPSQNPAKVAARVQTPFSSFGDRFFWGSTRPNDGNPIELRLVVFPFFTILYRSLSGRGLQTTNMRETTLKIIGPSYRGVWICMAGFYLQPTSFEIPWFLGWCFFLWWQCSTCLRHHYVVFCGVKLICVWLVTNVLGSPLFNHEHESPNSIHVYKVGPYL